MSWFVDSLDGFLCFNDWAGYREVAVRIVGETPKRYRILAITPTQLPGRRRWLDVGAAALVPKTAVRVVDPSTQPGGAA